MKTLRRTVSYLPSGKRQLFSLLSEPEVPPRGLVVHVPAFAEEMNKSRRMITLATEGLVEDGWSVLLFDFSGCGDSSEVLEEIAWEMWIEDLDSVLSWSRLRFPGLGVVLWSLRGGALIASEWMAWKGQNLPVLMWQPTLSGKLQLTQFLRLKAANDMLSEMDARNVMADLRKKIEEGEPVDVAGYRVSAKLAGGMSRAVFDLSVKEGRDIAILEVGSAEGSSLSPALQGLVEKASIGTFQVFAQKIAGAAFWSTQYIETVPGLVTASRKVLEQFRV